MHIKKNLAIAAAVAVLAVPALGATNANAMSISYDQANKSTQKAMAKINWDHVNHNAHITVNGKRLTVSPDRPGGRIISSSNIKSTNSNTSNSRVSNKVNKSNNQENTISSKSNQSNVNNAKANNNTQDGKLAQTGESNTGAKAGIVGVIAAIASVAFAGVEKFFKRA